MLLVVRLREFICLGEQQIAAKHVDGFSNGKVLPVVVVLLALVPTLTSSEYAHLIALQEGVCCFSLRSHCLFKSE